MLDLSNYRFQLHPCSDDFHDTDLFQNSHEENVDRVLRRRFDHFDEENNGRITKDELKKMLNAKG